MPTDDLTVTEFAAAAGLSRHTVKRWCQKGQLPGAYKKGHLWLIPPTAAPPQLPTGGAAHGKRKETGK